MRFNVMSVMLTASLVLPAVSRAQSSNETIDLLAGFKPQTQTVAGEWSLDGDEVRAAAGKGARAILATRLPGSYQVDIEFTRNSGSDVVALILPVGTTAVSLELSSWGGEAHGLARVDEQTSRSPQNPTSVRPGKLENGKRYRLFVRVSSDGDNGTIEAKLDGKQLITWNGPTARLKPHVVFNLPKQTSLGLTAHNSDVTFHKVVLQADLNPAVLPATTSPRSPGDAQLTNLAMAQTPGWVLFNSARFTLDPSGDTVSSVPGAGSGDRGAFLEGVTFSNGTIELDLKGDARPQQSFVGVSFHGVDGRTYESIYFRPFNFGSSDPVRRSHAVQYIAHPEWPWQRLREGRSGQYEKAVVPEPQPAEWFHARIEVAGDTVRVFVNNSDNPSLEVKRLAKQSSGKVGLWFNGIASFKNFVVTPEK